jgi:hypothetical protein
VSYMQKNCWIVADDDEPFIIRNITQTEKTVSVYGFGGHFGFEGRITIPPAGLYAIEKTGSADAVVKEFIMKSTAAANRSLNIVCEEAHGGTVISDQSRLRNLGDEVSRVLVGAGRGERFRICSGYISFMQNRIWQKHNKLCFVFFSVFLLIIGSFTIYYNLNIYITQKKTNALQLAQSAAVMIPVEILDKLNADPEDIYLSEYSQIKNSLMGFKKINLNVDFAYFIFNFFGYFRFEANTEYIYKLNGYEFT